MVLVPPATSRLLAPPAQSLGRSGSGLGVSSFHGWGLPTPPDLVILIWEREEKSQVQSAVLPADFSLTPQLWFSLSVSGSIGRLPPLFLVSFAASFLYQFKCTSSPIQADYVHFFTLTLLLKATAKEGAVQRHVAFALLGAGRAQKLML